MNEKDKHWNKIKLYAQKWREAEDKEGELKLKIIALTVEMEQHHKDALVYAKKCRHSILVEVV